jgi:hypothetical protein
VITVRLTMNDNDAWEATLMNGDQAASISGAIPFGEGDTIPEALIELAQDIREKSVMEIEHSLFEEKTPE